ncbi:MAG: hypothetical protein SNH35_04620 [Rikenellaceae bacterium]
MKSELQKEIARKRVETAEFAKLKAAEKAMEQDAKESLEYGVNYLKSAKSAFNAPLRRFNNDLIYNIISISFEQFMVGLLAHHDWIASSHLPLMLYREALPFEPEMGEEIKQTAILIGSFEGICSIEDFGYRTPSDDKIEDMITGLEYLQAFILARVSGTNS